MYFKTALSALALAALAYAFSDDVHIKVYSNAEGQHGSEVYWHFVEAPGGGDGGLSIQAIAPGDHGIEEGSMHITDGGCWFKTCYNVEAVYYENAPIKPVAPGEEPGELYHLRAKYNFVFQNGNSYATNCECLQDCGKCDLH